MIEYPSIAFSAKAPRKRMVAFDKLDGSNFRAKWVAGKGFVGYGTRTQLINEDTEYWGDMVRCFKTRYQTPLEQHLNITLKTSKGQKPVQEAVIFGEYLGPNSFAGKHCDGADAMRIVFFDVLLGKKQRKFLLPYEFIDYLGDVVEIPRVIYEGNLTKEFITEIVSSTELNEGVICKGCERSGAYSGNVWMCKIKTQAYLDRLKETFKESWKKYV